MFQPKVVCLDSSNFSFSQKISNFIQDIDRQKGNYPLAILGRELDKSLLRKLKSNYNDLNNSILECEELLGKVSTLQSGKFDDILQYQQELIMDRNSVGRKIEDLQEQIEHDLVKKRDFQRNWKLALPAKSPSVKRCQSLPVLSTMKSNFDSSSDSLSILKKRSATGTSTMPRSNSNVSIDPSVTLIYFDQDETTLNSPVATELVFCAEPEDSDCESLQ